MPPGGGLDSNDPVFFAVTSSAQNEEPGAETVRTGSGSKASPQQYSLGRTACNIVHFIRSMPGIYTRLVL